MNTDIRLKTTFPNHIKTRLLIKRLGKDAVFSLIALWCYCAENHQKGDISKLTNEQIAIAAQWDKDPDDFANALVDIGFIDETIADNGSIIRKLHDWEEHNRYVYFALERSEAARRSAAARWSKKLKTDIMQSACETHATRMQSVCDSYAPNPNPNPNPTPNPIPFICDADKSASTYTENEKRTFLDYVLLTDVEHQKLVNILGDKKTNDYIERLNDYIHQIGKQKAKNKYKSHYHVILNWHRRDMSELERRLHVLNTLQKNKEQEYFQ